MFPKMGKVFPGGYDREAGETMYAVMIAQALRAELGNTHQAVKTVMRWTGASERTVKHWLSGRHGPSGDYLLALLRESETVFETLLSAIGHRDIILAARVLAAHGTMLEAMTMFEVEGSGMTHAGLLGVGRIGGKAVIARDDRKSDRTNDPVRPAPGVRLNPRQRWYLEALASGQDVRARHLQRLWSVSEKTARRDVAALKGCGMIEFIGPLRTGKYRLSC